MKVLHINTHNTGGAAKACLRIHAALLSEGVDSKVLLRNKTEQDSKEVYEIWDGLSYVAKGKKYLEQKKLDKINEKKREKLGSSDELFSFPESIWDITSHELYDWADIIHLHWVAGFIDYKTFFQKNTKKLVWTIHDEEPFSGGFHYPPTTAITSYTERIKQQISLKEKALKNQLITVVSPSQFLADKSKRSSPFGTFKHHTIKNCTNTESFQYKEKNASRVAINLPLDKKLILFVADNLSYRRKGFSFLAECMKSMNDKDVALCTVGENDLSDSSIINLGKISSEQKMNLVYAAADLLVVPSSMDNLPNTISEALCSGTPIIGFNVGGIPEMITKKDGIVCSVGTVELTDSIALGLSKLWDRVKISESNSQVYSEKSCAQRYIEIYGST